MRCFVAEVRGLFPVKRQKKRKPRKQRNTEPSLELNQITGLLKSVLRAHRLNNKNLFCSCFNVAGYLFILFPFMVEIFVCFPSRTSSPFKVSRYTCWYNFSFYIFICIIFNSPYHLPDIFYPPYHLPVHVSFEFDFSRYGNKNKQF